MLGFTIAKKSELDAQATKLANAEAKAASQAKKTRTTAIIGGSTTAAAAVVAGVLHFGIGKGNKKVKEKLNNYDLIVEERNKAIDDATGLKAERDRAINLAIASDGCCHKLAAAIDAHDGKEMHTAIEGHKSIHKELFNDISEESFNAAVAAYDEFIKSLTAQDQQNAQNAQIPQNNQNAQNAQIPQNQNDQAQKIADAQNRYNDACAKAGAAKTAFENAEKKLAAAKASAPDGDHKDLEAAVTEAKTAFDAADKELTDAKTILETLQKK